MRISCSSPILERFFTSEWIRGPTTAQALCNLAGNEDYFRSDTPYQHRHCNSQILRQAAERFAGVRVPFQPFAGAGN